MVQVELDILQVKVPSKHSTQCNAAMSVALAFEHHGRHWPIALNVICSCPHLCHDLIATVLNQTCYDGLMSTDVSAQVRTGRIIAIETFQNQELLVVDLRVTVDATCEYEDLLRVIFEVT